LNFLPNGHGPFEVVLVAEEALPAVYGHIQQSVAAYSCNSVIISIKLSNYLLVITVILFSYLPALF
jgi:hypothetical protein